VNVIMMKDLFVGPGGGDVSPEARAALAQADVILGVDRRTQREFTIFGTPSFEETVQLGQEVSMNTVRVELDDCDGELNKLATLVRSIKGRP
jgi:hypothetical protein